MKNEKLKANRKWKKWSKKRIFYIWKKIDVVLFILIFVQIFIAKIVSVLCEGCSELFHQ